MLLAALGLLVCWGFGAVALHTGGAEGRKLREAVQQSTILAALNDALPPSGPLLNVLRRVDPDRRRARPAGATSARRVRVWSTSRACGRRAIPRCASWAPPAASASPARVGSPGHGLVVTNAHVVAGEDDTTVTPDGGEALDAVAVHYDPRNDLAILRVDGLGSPALELAARPRKGDDASVIGYPGNGPLTFTPARLGRTGTVLSEDSYGRGPVEREMTPFRADVRSGNSGGPVVDDSGRVTATVFAAASGGGRINGLGVPNPVVAEALGGSLKPTATGPCAA